VSGDADSGKVSYVLRIHLEVALGSKKYTVTKTVSWADEEDARECKRLLDKATLPKFMSVSFAKVTADEPF
jgi:hypothetical protein